MKSVSVHRPRQSHTDTLIQLSYTSASLFTREEVRFLSLDKIAFAKPVPIGSILRLTAHVLHTTSTAKFPILLVGSSPSPTLPLADSALAYRRAGGRCGRQDGRDADDERLPLHVGTRERRADHADGHPANVSRYALHSRYDVLHLFSFVVQNRCSGWRHAVPSSSTRCSGNTVNEETTAARCIRWACALPIEPRIEPIAIDVLLHVERARQLPSAGSARSRTSSRIETNKNSAHPSHGPLPSPLPARLPPVPSPPSHDRYTTIHHEPQVVHPRRRLPPGGDHPFVRMPAHHAQHASYSLLAALSRPSRSRTSQLLTLLASTSRVQPMAVATLVTLSARSAYVAVSPLRNV
jgi:hypothetical protein